MAKAPKFSKKHYEAIAAVIKTIGEDVEAQGPIVHGEIMPGVIEVTSALTIMFAQDNDRFDSEAFLKATMTDRHLEVYDALAGMFGRMEADAKAKGYTVLMF